jgi:hypothetical protein
MRPARKRARREERHHRDGSAAPQPRREKPPEPVAPLGTLRRNSCKWRCGVSDRYGFGRSDMRIDLSLYDR